MGHDELGRWRQFEPRPHNYAAPTEPVSVM